VCVTDYVKLRPYRVARVEPLRGSEDVEAAERAPLLKIVTQLAKARARLGVDLPKSVLSALRSVKNADHLSDLVSYTLLDDYYEKQSMLETLDTNERLEKLVALLQRKINQFELWKSLQGKLPNKHVGYN